MPEDTDTLDGPRRDPDLGPAKPRVESVQTQTEKVDLAIRARKLKVVQEQEKLIEDANSLTRFDRPIPA